MYRVRLCTDSERVSPEQLELLPCMRGKDGFGGMTMTKRDQMMECMSVMEDGMSRTAQHRDIWQNELIYWLCKAVYLLLDRAVKDRKDE